MKFEWVGSKAMLSGNYLRFSKGKYFIQIEGYEIATGIREGMITLAKIIATQIKDRPPEPPILALLPSRNKINGSTKLFRSNWTLRQLYSTLPVNIPQLTDTAIGVSRALPGYHEINRLDGCPNRFHHPFRRNRYCGVCLHALPRCRNERGTCLLKSERVETFSSTKPLL